MFRCLLFSLVLASGFLDTAQAKPFLKKGQGLQTQHPIAQRVIIKARSIDRAVKNGVGWGSLRTIREIRNELAGYSHASKVARALKFLNRVESAIRNNGLPRLERFEIVSRNVQRFVNNISQAQIFKVHNQPRQFVLNLYGKEYTGKSVVGLRATANKQLGFNFPGYRLQKVVVHAKSRGGRGTIRVLAGNQFSLAKNVPGNPYDFNLETPRTYRKVQFKRLAAEGGNWQLHLRGNIKIDKIVIKAVPFR